jgi:hypothetical protein
VPGVPGWAMAEVYYHTSLTASGAVAAARQIQVGRFPATVNVNLNASLTGQGGCGAAEPQLHVRHPRARRQDRGITNIQIRPTNSRVFYDECITGPKKVSK